MTIADLEFNGRTVLTLCGFLAAAILGLYLLLPQLAGLEDTWSRIEDGSPGWIVLAFVLTFGMFGGYVEMFRGVFGAVDRIGRQRELPDHDGRAGGVADLRRGRRRRARAAGLGAAPGGPAQAHRGRQDDRLPGADLLPVRGRGRDLRRRPAARPLPGRGAVHDDGDPGHHRRDPDGAHEPDPARADRPAAPAGRLRAPHGHARPDHEAAGDDPRRDVRRPARGARRTSARATPRCWARSPSGPSRSPSCGPPSRPSATRRRSRCSSRPSSSACSATCCRSPVASAASKVA